jgi:CheY-like chemotaxis protein
MDEMTPPLAIVVDDEELLRIYAAGLLEEYGFTVLEAENATTALKLSTLAETFDYFLPIFWRAAWTKWTWCERSMRCGPMSVW